MVIRCQNDSLINSNCMFSSFEADWHTYAKSPIIKITTRRYAKAFLTWCNYSASLPLVCCTQHHVRPPAQTCQVHCFCANDSLIGHPVPITGLRNRALSRQGHEPDGFKLQYRKCAHSSNKCKATWASNYLVLCFETSRLLLPFIRRVLQLGNWQ